MKPTPEFYFEELLERRTELAPCMPSIRDAYAQLRNCFSSGNRLYLCGNGGSAADAEHWAGELLKGFYLRRNPVFTTDSQPRELLNLQQGLPAIPLTGFLSLRTAVANDISADLEYAQLVWALGKKDDILVGISTSGNAQNVLLATQAAKQRDMKTIALTGELGGKLVGSTDLAIKVPAQKTHHIQELHLSIYHTLCLALEAHFFGDGQTPDD